MNPTMPPMDVPPSDWERQEAALTDDAAYRLVADVLDEAPATDLSPDFAREMERRAYAQRREPLAERLESRLIGAAILLLGAIATISVAPLHLTPPAGTAWLIVAIGAVGVGMLGWRMQRRSLP